MKLNREDIVTVKTYHGTYTGIVLVVDNENEEAAVYIEWGTNSTRLLFLPFSDLMVA